MPGGLGDLEVFTHLLDRELLPDQLPAFAELADDLLGGVSSSRHVVNRPPAPILVHQNPHNLWTCPKGSSHLVLAMRTRGSDLFPQ